MDTYQNDTPDVAAEQSPVTPPPLVTQPETTPVLPLGKPKSSSPIIPMLLGVVVVVIVSSFFAGLYYFSKLKKEVASVTPSPSPSVMASPTVEPSATATASASPKTSAKPSSKASSKPTTIATDTPKASTTSSPTPTPVTSSATLDVRFGNPSAHIKQTYDDNTGAGRVINREFSSTQIGEFDELKSGWAAKITTCFHVVSNQDTEGSKLGYTLREDDKVVAEGTLSQYSKIEAGKTYDVCRDVSIGIGTHKIELTINNAKALGESTYANNTARLDYKNLADNIAPNFTLSGPYNWNENGTCFLLNYPNDNVTEVKDLKIEHKIDSGDWVTQPKADYCFKGNSGSAHSYAVRMTDARGNKNEQSSTFNLY
ncbi:hypothetical protein KBD69_00145 [Candidatus Woesebacteria bacterium]|nr:hypothetical protein [Candidatus Woesebacteria bacterium]